MQINRAIAAIIQHVQSMLSTWTGDIFVILAGFWSRFFWCLNYKENQIEMINIADTVDIGKLGVHRE